MMDIEPRTPSTPPFISPLGESPDTGRPLWSVMIPAYNCGAYLEETILSVLDQDPGEGIMQIEVCDDSSTDLNVSQLVDRVGRGRVGYYHQPRNVGSLRNFETCLNRSRGHLIHLLHGDDKVRIGFYKKMEHLMNRHPTAGAAFCRFVSIDQENGEEFLSEKEAEDPGILENWLKRLACKQLIQTPTMVVRRKVYERLGGFYAVHYGEDWEMWLRIAANYPTAYLPETLAEYRKHENSISGQYALNGQNIRDLKTVMHITKRYFSPADWEPIHQQARAFYAHYAINTARRIWGRTHHRKGTLRQIREAFNLHQDKEVWTESFKLFIKMILGIKK